MILLFILSLYFSPSDCSLRDLMIEQQAMEAMYERLGLGANRMELIDIMINDLVIVYPSLSTSSNEELITFKREFYDFLYDSVQEQKELLAGFPSRYKVLPGKLIELCKITKREFEDLSMEDKEYIDTHYHYIIHKLLVQFQLNISKRRNADFEKRKLTKKQIKKEIVKNSSTVFYSWYKEDEIEDAKEDLRKKYGISKSRSKYSKSKSEL